MRPVMVWAGDIEEVLIHWSEEARCLQWMHVQAHRMYRRKYHQLIIPIIVLSTFTGGVSIGMQSFVPVAGIIFTQLGVGVLNLAIGMMTTLLNFFNYAEKTQAHLSTANMWYKLYRRIGTELAIHSDNRSHATDFFDSVRKEYEMILEQSPEIDKATVREFRHKFAEQMRARHNMDERDIEQLSEYMLAPDGHGASVGVGGGPGHGPDPLGSRAAAAEHEPAILDSLRDLRSLGTHGRRRQSVESVRDRVRRERGPDVHVPMLVQPFVPTPIYANYVHEYRARHAATRPYVPAEVMVAAMTPSPSSANVTVAVTPHLALSAAAAAAAAAAEAAPPNAAAAAEVAAAGPRSDDSPSSSQFDA
jgi:hypothetical protein